jgi:hypothetical protein
MKIRKGLYKTKKHKTYKNCPIRAAILVAICRSNLKDNNALSTLPSIGKAGIKLKLPI